MSSMEANFMSLLQMMQQMGVTMEDMEGPEFDDDVMYRSGRLATCHRQPPPESPMHKKLKSLKPGDVAPGFNYNEAFFEESFFLSGEWHWSAISEENPRSKEKLEKTTHVDWDFVTKKKIKRNGDEELFTRVFPVARKPVPRGKSYTPPMEVIRLVLAHAAAHQYSVCQLDIALHRIEVELPEDYDVYVHHVAHMGGELWEDGEPIINRLVKPIHGVKYANELWYNDIRDYLVKKLKFSQLHDVNGVWVYAPENSMKVIVMLSGDDIIICGKTEADVKWITSKFKADYIVEELGVPSEFAGCRIKFDFDQRTIELDCQSIIECLAKKYSIEFDPSVTTAMAEDFDTQWQEIGSKQELLGPAYTRKKAQFEQLTEDLKSIYLSTRFDIASPLTKLLGLRDYANDFLIKTAYRVFQYLVNTRTNKLTFRRRADTERRFVGYANTNCNGFNGRSTYTIFIFKHGPVSWQTGVVQNLDLEWTKTHAQELLETKYDTLYVMDNFLLTGQTPVTTDDDGEK
ncbi:hypothetical protein DIURU_002689 [Diutina rugosa]|uniref:Reverse transcriptase Ty1/copia-type domain-containing protein n=1 Tax=Diutina rugosa TaxID=5481 RepID=A0A642UP14_DIURU|nr:uncharacterized protein DIURU_002689 [Diutina rugosa]KAA8902793.1 hypothetical protein DIURU_002689 [Diutina rugosa]